MQQLKCQEGKGGKTLFRRETHGLGHSYEGEKGSEREEIGSVTSCFGST